MPLDGAPDFQAQSVQTVSFITSIAVNTNAQQTTDISALIQPYHQCLVVYWKPNPGSTGTGLLVTINAPLLGVTFEPARLVADLTSATFTVPGQMSVGSLAGGCNVIASVVPGGVTPIAGTLIVMALSHLPTVLPQSNLVTNGTSLSSGAIVAGAAATTTILAAPLQGTYNRVKCLSWRASVAPAAAAGIDWLDGGTLLEIALTEIAAAVAQSAVTPIDWITTGAVRLHNASSIGIAACVAYENYPI